MRSIKEKNCAFADTAGNQATILLCSYPTVYVFINCRKWESMQGIITDPKSILGELVASREHGNVIGIWAPPLGRGLFMCAVETIIDDDVEHDKVIILKEKDLNGVQLAAHVLFLQEIEKVYPLKTLYSDSLQQQIKSSD